MFRGTAQEFADLNKIEYVTANVLLRFLTDKKLARKTGKRPPAGKGKPSDLYEVPSRLAMTFVGNVIPDLLPSDAPTPEVKEETKPVEQPKPPTSGVKLLPYYPQAA